MGKKNKDLDPSGLDHIRGDLFAFEVESEPETQDPAPEPAPTAPALPPGASHLWRGMPVYKCVECPWDTLSPDKLELHTDAHRRARAAAQPPSRIIRTDRYGNELK